MKGGNIRFDFHEQVAVVTGAGQGLGRTLCLEFAAAGAGVAAVDVVDENVNFLAGEIEETGGEALALRVDVSNSKDIRYMVDKTMDRWGRIDVLVNNAGIAHRGDIFSLSVLDELELIAPVLAAEGDDDLSLTARDRRVERKHTINIEGATIWLVHQKPGSLPPVKKEVTSLDDPPDVIGYGHTHKAVLEKKDGILQINPGSPTFPNYRLQLGTVGLLTVNSDKVEAEIVQLK